MKKNKTFLNVRFTPEVIRKATNSLLAYLDQEDKGRRCWTLDIQMSNGERWSHDTESEFFADYRKEHDSSTYRMTSDEFTLASCWASHTYYGRGTDIAVSAPSRHQIESVFAVFEEAVQACTLPPIPRPPPPPKDPPCVFVGHGRSPVWRDLKDHLQEKHGIKIEAYETGARAGHTIRDILEDMATRSSFALLVMTGEDEQADGQLRARQNVIHEAGLFQGRLGFPRAIILLEEGVEEFSNVQGVQYIRFSQNNIKETFGEVLATLRREFSE